jgi:hypothetical protein
MFGRSAHGSVPEPILSIMCQANTVTIRVRAFLLADSVRHRNLETSHRARSGCGKLSGVGANGVAGRALNGSVGTAREDCAVDCCVDRGRDGRRRGSPAWSDAGSVQASPANALHGHARQARSPCSHRTSVRPASNRPLHRAASYSLGIAPLPARTGFPRSASSSWPGRMDVVLGVSANHAPFCSAAQDTTTSPSCVSGPAGLLRWSCRRPAKLKHIHRDWNRPLRKRHRNMLHQARVQPTGTIDDLAIARHSAQSEPGSVDLLEVIASVVR